MNGEDVRVGHREVCSMFVVATSGEAEHTMVTGLVVETWETAETWLARMKA